jgi:hypothetical protein
MAELVLKSGQAVMVEYGPVAEALDDVILLPGTSLTISAASDSPTPGPGPSGIPINPIKQGWRRVGQTDFDDFIPLGSWTGDKQGVLIPRPDAARDGEYSDSSGRSKYNARKTVSQEGSVLICRLLQESSGQRYSGSPRQKLAAMPSGRWSWASKVDGPEEGWKIAVLVSVEGSNVSTRGEFDLPECILSIAPYVNGFIHKVGGALVSKRISEITGHRGECYRWHQWTIEVVSGKSVSMELDGQQFLKVTDGVTKENVSLKLQHETRLKGQSIPAQMGEARILYDWLTIDVPA